MKDLIKALLDYSRLGQGNLKIVPVDMGKILDDLIEVLQTAITEKEATITLVDRLPVIHADRLHMQQLLQNLLSNALKFSRHGISPEIKIFCKEGTNEIGHACWKFSVKDNGIGIKEEYFEKAQMIFQRLNDRDAYEGTGIGLAICKRIVERHQGFLSIESAEGVGSTFHFHLPKHPNSPTLQA
ncbi:MAG: ATP-binding protein [Verrucomicrobiota bacterium]